LISSVFLASGYSGWTEGCLEGTITWHLCSGFLTDWTTNRIYDPCD
jgi:hypothetical protein